MLEIENYDKMVGQKLILHNMDIPSNMLEWVCERVIKFPDDDLLGSVSVTEAYRFEFKAVSGYDVPLCIYLNRTQSEDGTYKLENNLMDVNTNVSTEQITNKNLFQYALQLYAQEVIFAWHLDQNG